MIPAVVVAVVTIFVAVLAVDTAVAPAAAAAGWLAEPFAPAPRTIALTPTTVAPTQPAGIVPPTVPGAIAGNDISWTQCSVAQGGYANPMPDDAARFVVMGLSAGQAFTTNPCLAAELGWVRSHHALVAGYVFPTYPSDAQYATYGASGPYSSATVQGRLMNVGYQQAAYWVNVIRTAGLNTPMVWVDIETSKRGPQWTTQPADRNLPVILGVLAGLTQAGFRTGIYTTSAHWKEITGGVRLGQPDWRTAGRNATQAQALALCGKPGNQGSPVLLVQYFTANVDYDVLCPITTGALLTNSFHQY